ncbi:MAG: hypothetical protein A2Y40_09750 [Candidatus Margulisbacteria bacterium GWF2_35_9]|nr:MAG: hypothetical protein A2Y40_09750 [Candidatus Margulisbacteria bacterium GWF2_35_9]
MSKKLGRGLSALIPDYSSVKVEENDHTFLKDVDINYISKNKYQPRLSFSNETINELAESINQNGLIQPIVVRFISHNNYELISGERRLRAVESLGHKTIPALINKDVSDKASMVMSLIENIQREDINPLEQAIAYTQIINEHQFTQKELSELVGKNRSSIANVLRLLDLNQECKDALLSGTISEGHARALLHFKDSSTQSSFLHQIIKNNLTVREAEQLSNTSKSIKNKMLSHALSGSKYMAKYSFDGKKGKFVINVSSENEFNAIKEFLLNA